MKTLPSTISINAFHLTLQRWYAAHGRHDLPWRTTKDPYAIYLSEVMLQQTQVKTVLERYYFPFLHAFPTLKALASAPREDVLKQWQGLGYYSRAANLHKAAQACAPALPCSVEGLMALSGIGRNTAHAVAAFAFRLPVPVMEANVKRVLTRIFALSHPSEKDLWTRAEQLLDAKNPFDYNQAMMDIGALICAKRAPKCSECPAQEICAGKNTPELFPARKASKKIPVRKRSIIVRMDQQGRIHATPRTTRFLHGLYEFDEMPEIPKSAAKLGCISQNYSHFTLEAEVYLQRTGKKERGNNWYSLTEFAKLPHSKAEEKILALIEQ